MQFHSNRTSEVLTYSQCTQNCFESFSSRELSQQERCCEETHDCGDFVEESGHENPVLVEKWVTTISICQVAVPPSNVLCAKLSTWFLWVFKRQHMNIWKASRIGDVAMVEMLLKTPTIDINARDEDGWTPLLIASLRGRLPVVEALLKANADPNAPFTEGSTPLHLAFDHLPVVEVLLKATADPNAQNKDGETPLHEPSLWGRLTVVEAFLEANADPNVTDIKGETPLHKACDHDHHKIVRSLLVSGADIHSKNNEGHEPLHMCIHQRSYPELTTDSVLTLQLLVSYGAIWDSTCDKMVTSGKAWEEAPALKVCMQLWAREHAKNYPFTDIPIEVVKRGTNSTETYIKSLKAAREIILRSKICLVGCSCSGKTSFVKSIILRLPQLVNLLDERTIGIDHFPLRFLRKVPLNFWRRIVSGEKLNAYEVIFWDFAGQDAYQVAHSAFFTPRTMFFVFIDLQAFFIAYMQAAVVADQDIQEPKLLDEFFDRAVLHWIRMILSRQPDAEFVFIASKEDLAFENVYIENVIKRELMLKLRGVDMIVEKMKRQVNQIPVTNSAESHPDYAYSQLNNHTVLYVSSSSPKSIYAARIKVEELITNSKRSIPMPDNYAQVLDAIVKIREDAKTHNNITTRVERVFTPVNVLPQQLKIDPNSCRAILQTLHDLGDVLWYENLEVGVLRHTVILEPMLLIDFIRQIITHKHTGLIMQHDDLSVKKYWIGLNDHNLLAMKMLLQEFHLVYSARKDRKMRWDSDLIVPAFWQTKIPASWLFLGQDLKIKTPDATEELHIFWELKFHVGLPSPLFDHIVVASLSSMIEFDAGPDWILYDGKEGMTACRAMVHRDRPSLLQTIQVEAVVAVGADTEQVAKLWCAFERLVCAVFRVVGEFKGCRVSCRAKCDEGRSYDLKDLLPSTEDPPYPKWMPPREMWTRLDISKIQ